MYYAHRREPGQEHSHDLFRKSIFEWKTLSSFKTSSYNFLHSINFVIITLRSLYKDDLKLNALLIIIQRFARTI